MSYFHSFHIKNYHLTLVGDKEGIAQLMIHNHTRELHIDDKWIEKPDLFEEAKQQLEEYFEGKRQTFNLKLTPNGTPYQQKVWQILEQIPYGQLYSYKDVAIQLGDPNASRAIGLANNRNPIPILIPCHRVVGSNGKMMSYAYGVQMKRDLIEMESYHSFFKSVK